MKIAIREADLKSDRAVLIETLLRYLTPLSDERRFDWLYRKNPHGEARAWVACDAANGTVIGAAAAFPRRMLMEGREVLGWVLGDFCISDKCRSLGPALSLQRACLQDVDSGRMAFCYDFPSASMMAIYTRLRIAPVEKMVRLANPLRVDRKVKELVKHPALATGVSLAGNVLLRLGQGTHRKTHGLTFRLHDEDCGEEFSKLAWECALRSGRWVHRSAEYLNWRYRDNPLGRFELLTAHRDGRLLAYAVFAHEQEDAVIADVFGIEENGSIASLLSKLVALLRARGVSTVSAPMVQSHPWLPIFQRVGFRPRESSPVVVYYPFGLSPGGGVYDGGAWWLMHGDRDS